MNKNWYYLILAGPFIGYGIGRGIEEAVRKMLKRKEK